MEAAPQKPSVKTILSPCPPGMFPCTSVLESEFIFRLSASGHPQLTVQGCPCQQVSLGKGERLSAIPIVGIIFGVIIPCTMHLKNLKVTNFTPTNLSAFLCVLSTRKDGIEEEGVFWRLSMEENKTLRFSFLFTPCKLVTQHFSLGNLYPLSDQCGVPGFWLCTPMKS